MSPTCYLGYLMEYAFTFTFASREFPPMWRMCIIIIIIIIIIVVNVSARAALPGEPNW